MAKWNSNREENAILLLSYWNTHMSQPWNGQRNRNHNIHLCGINFSNRLFPLLVYLFITLQTIKGKLLRLNYTPTFKNGLVLSRISRRNWARTFTLLRSLSVTNCASQLVVQSRPYHTSGVAHPPGLATVINYDRWALRQPGRVATRASSLGWMARKENLIQPWPKRPKLCCLLQTTQSFCSLAPIVYTCTDGCLRTFICDIAALSQWLVNNTQLRIYQSVPQIMHHCSAFEVRCWLCSRFRDFWPLQRCRRRTSMAGATPSTNQKASSSTGLHLCNVGDVYPRQLALITWKQCTHHCLFSHRWRKSPEKVFASNMHTTRQRKSKFCFQLPKLNRL